MRKLNPLKAIKHALKSLRDYPGMVMRIGLFWIPVLFILGLAEWLTSPADLSQPPEGAAIFLQTFSAVVGLIAFCSMAVSWHLFILRDDVGSPARIDSRVWRYAGNSMLIMLMILAPVLLIATVTAVLPAVLSIIFIPLALVAGTAATRLSIKLPAVALGRTDFGFRDAWSASEGNFWQIAGVFALNAAIVLSAGFAFMAIVWAASQVSSHLAAVVALLIGAVFQLLYTVFNASIFTSLYGFFVEKRNF